MSGSRVGGEEEGGGGLGSGGLGFECLEFRILGFGGGLRGAAGCTVESDDAAPLPGMQRFSNEPQRAVSIDSSRPEHTEPYNIQLAGHAFLCLSKKGCPSASIPVKIFTFASQSEPGGQEHRFHRARGPSSSPLDTKARHRDSSPQDKDTARHRDYRPPGRLPPLQPSWTLWTLMDP